MGGAGGAFTIEGEAGIGKSRLVEESLGAVEGFSLFAAAGDEMEGERPFGLIADALRLSGHSDEEEQRRLGRRLLGEPGTGHQDQTGLRYLMIEEIVDMVERLASGRPLVLWLDDLHSDGASHRLPRGRWAEQSGCGGETVYLSEYGPDPSRARFPKARDLFQAGAGRPSNTASRLSSIQDH